MLVWPKALKGKYQNTITKTVKGDCDLILAPLKYQQ